MGETHKGKTYYRCHSRHKPVGLRADQIGDKISGFFDKLKLTPDEEQLIDSITEHMRTSAAERSRQNMEAARMALLSLDQKIDRITEAYIDGLISKNELERKKTALVLERREMERQLSELENGNQPGQARCEKIVELIKTAYLLYKNGSDEEKRDLVKELLSNRIASQKTIDITARFPFANIAKHHDVRFGGPLPGRIRDFWKRLLNQIVMSVQIGAAHKPPLCA